MTPIDNLPTQKDIPTRLADFAGSEVFSRLFREGMDLVEETANYLDGPGREDAKRLGRTGALSYAADSMALTTQLMQCASWLLTQRAVAEGDMDASEAAEQRYRLTPSKLKAGNWPADDDQCPPRLADMVVRAKSLHERLMRIDQSLFEDDQEKERDPVNPVANQLDALNKAFGV